MTIGASRFFDMFVLSRCDGEHGRLGGTVGVEVEVDVALRLAQTMKQEPTPHAKQIKRGFSFASNP